MHKSDVGPEVLIAEKLTSSVKSDVKKFAQMYEVMMRHIAWAREDYRATITFSEVAGALGKTPDELRVELFQPLPIPAINLLNNV